MDGWTEGCVGMDRRKGGWLDGRMSGWLDRGMGGHLDGGMVDG